MLCGTRPCAQASVDLFGDAAGCSSIEKTTFWRLVRDSVCRVMESLSKDARGVQPARKE